MAAPSSGIKYVAESGAATAANASVLKRGAVEVNGVRVKLLVFVLLAGFCVGFVLHGVGYVVDKFLELRDSGQKMTFEYK